jgi:hypothetical protein
MMTFIDGPVANQLIEVDVADVQDFIRVAVDDLEVEAPRGRPDPLPTPTQKLYAYMLIKQPYQYSVKREQTPNRLDWIVAAEYRFAPIQPSQAVMMSDSLWDEWIRENRRNTVTQRRRGQPDPTPKAKDK